MLAHRTLRLGVLLFISIGSAWPALAQGVGAVRGTVTDNTGAVLPGATVVLSAAQGAVGGNQETVADPRGTFAFVRLPPGTYSVRAQLAGFQTVTQGNIVVNADATARADLRLSVGAIEEAITVTTQVPLLDTTNAGKQTTITKAELDALPNRTDIWSVTKVLPSVVMNKIDVGGSEAFNASVPIVRGATGDSKFMVDGMDVSSPSGAGTIANFYLDPFSFEETSIQLGAGSAENSTGGINFNMMTRSGHQRVPRRREDQRHDARAGQREELLRRAPGAAAGRRAAQGAGGEPRSRARCRHPEDERHRRVARRTDRARQAVVRGDVARPADGSALSRRLQPGRLAGDRRQRALELHRQGVVAGHRSRRSCPTSPTSSTS